MNKMVCDHCGKDVDQYAEGAIHGACELYVCLGMHKTNSWLRLFRGKIRHVKNEDDGAWCNADCLAAWARGYTANKPIYNTGN